MAKFCTGCGKQLNDDAKFCTSCGTKVAAPKQQSEEPEIEPVNNEEPVIQPVEEEKPIEQPAVANAPKTKQVTLSVNLEKFKLDKIDKEKVKKYGTIAAIAVASLVAIIIIFSLIFPGPKAIAKKHLKALKNADGSAYADTMAPFISEIIFDDYKTKEIDDHLEDLLDDKFFGEKVKFKVTDVDDISSSKKREYREEFRDMEEYIDDFDADEVTKIKKVRVSAKFDGDEEKYTLYMIKYDGKWYVLASEIDTYFF